MTAPAHSTFERHLPLAGTYNVRDVGGYATTDGRTTRWRTLLRADSLHRLSGDAQNALIAEGLRTVIDLRHGAELTEAPNVFLSSDRVRYASVPVFEDPTVAPSSPSALPRTLGEIYLFALERRAQRLVSAVATLADPTSLPALVHCTAGKDRTGLVVALALGAVGVPDQTIAEDYELSANYLTGSYFDEARARAELRGIPWETYRSRLVCPAPLMLETLDWLSEQYGGVEAYLLAHGLTSQQLAALREHLLDD